MKNIFIILIFCIASLAAAEESGWWKWLGPPVGEVTKLEPDPNHHQLWFAIYDGTLYRSRDAGVNWTPTSLTNVSDVAVQPSTSHVFASHTGSNFVTIWRSTDMGRTFQNYSTGERTTGLASPRIRFDPEASDHIYVVGGTLRRVREHRPWELFPNPIDISKPYHGCDVDEFLFYDVLSAPFQQGILYATGGPFYDCSHNDRNNEQPLLMASWNGGKSWKILERAPKNGVQYRFYYDARSPEIAYISGDRGVYSLTASGLKQVSSSRITNISVVPQKPLDIYGLIFRDLRRNPVDLVQSTNGGRSWTRLENDLLNGLSEMFVRDSSSLFGGLQSEGGLYLFANGRWTVSNIGFRTSDMSFVHRVSGARTVYAGKDVLYVSTDGGRNWLDRTVSLPSSFPPEVFRTNRYVGHPSNEKVLYFYGRDLYRTEDAGLSWTLVAAGPWKIEAFDPSHPETLYMTKRNDAAIYRSSDGGKTRQKLPIVLFTSFVRVVVSPTDPETIFFLDDQYVLSRSTDGGQTVQRITNRSFYDILARPIANQFLAIAAHGNSNEVWKTDDAGNTWSLIGHTPGEMIVNAGGPDFSRVWAYHYDRVFESVDGGKHWHDLQPQIPATGILQFATPESTRVYAATSEGIFVLDRESTNK